MLPGETDDAFPVSARRRGRGAGPGRAETDRERRGPGRWNRLHWVIEQVKANPRPGPWVAVVTR